MGSRTRIGLVAAALLLGACGDDQPSARLDASAGSPRTTSPAPSAEAVTATTTTLGAPSTTTTTTALAAQKPSPPISTTTSAAQQPFSVKAASLHFNTCFDSHVPHGGSGASYACNGTYKFILNPGTGGDLTWRLMTRRVGACDEEYSRTDGYEFFETLTGSIKVADGLTEASGPFEFYNENQVNPQMVRGAQTQYPSHARLEVVSGGSGSSPETAFYSDMDCSTGAPVPTS